jgi:hypothetical protein
MWISLENFKLFLNEIPRDTRFPDKNLIPFISGKCGIAESDILNYRIIRRTLDARKKRKIFFIYKLEVEVKESVNTEGRFPAPLLRKKRDLENLSLFPGISENPIIIGSGPAGLCSALLLAEYGLKPIVIDRGQAVDIRKRDIDSFMDSGELNTESNFLFGEGGAGTYSDGKLYTRKKDRNIAYILDRFVEAGAPEEIKYLKRPHIGSDKLPGMVSALRKKITGLGGEFIWGTRVDNVLLSGNRCKGVILSDGRKLSAPFVIIASGLSAEKLIRKLASKLEYSLKGFQVGCRIEHKQSLINKARYGIDPPPPCLGAAEYNLISRPPRGRALSASTFCMCPGGIVIPATNNEGRLSTNGMSEYSRSGKFSNAGIIVNQNPEDFKTAKEAFDFIEAIEKKAFSAGGGNFRCPAQSAYAFMNGEETLYSTDTSYNFDIIPARLDMILPEETVFALKEALMYFEKLIPGFMSSGTLMGVETHVSSPVRFIRDKQTLASSSARGLYIVGEGAGMAGGIISAAVDGLKIAEKIIREGID